MNLVCLFFLVCLSAFRTVNSARILAWFPTPSISHQVVFRPYTQELAKRGHEVTVVTTDPAFPPGEAPENLIEIDLHDVSYSTWRKQLNSNKIVMGKSDDMISMMAKMSPMMTAVYDMQFNSKEAQAIIGNKTNQFDLLVIEACARPALGLSYLYKVPVILFSSLGGLGPAMFDVMGAPSRPPLLYPTFIRQRLSNLSFLEKIREIYNFIRFERVMTDHDEEECAFVKKVFGPDTPSMRELDNNVDMIFLNVNPIWDWNRPVPRGIVYTGGLHQKPTKELPNELKTYLDSSVNGVIYISFGTNVNPSQLPPEKIQMLINVFSQLPYDVLWKWDKDELPGRSENIRISKWLPQSDLLKHPKIKLFITQGGLQSTDEAITAAVPLLGMPMLGDQWFNVEMYVRLKIGLKVEIDTMTEEKFKTAVNKLIIDESYRKNIIKLRDVMYDQPESPLERAVWWTEHVLRHGGARHLRAPAANMSWTEYLDSELLVVLASVTSIFVVVVLVFLHLLVKFLKRKIVGDTKLKSS